MQDGMSNGRDTGMGSGRQLMRLVVPSLARVLANQPPRPSTSSPQALLRNGNPLVQAAQLRSKVTHAAAAAAAAASVLHAPPQRARRRRRRARCQQQLGEQAATAGVLQGFDL